MPHSNPGGACGSGAWTCYGSNSHNAAATTNPEFELKSPLGPCVPTNTLQSLPDFLRWFGSFGTPLICKLSDLKSSNCSVLTGVGGDLVVKSLSSVLTDCGINTGGGGAATSVNCANVKAALESAGCVPAGTAATFLAYNASGFLVQASPTTTAETPLTVLDSSTVDLTAGPNGNGHTGLTASVKISAVAGNSLTANADGLYVPTAAVGTVSCAAVKTVLESAGCIPDGVISKELGYSSTGGLVQEARRKLIRMSYKNQSTSNDNFVDTLTNHGSSANRRTYKWTDADSAISAVSAGQVLGDLTYDSATGSFTIGHSAHYTFTVGILLRLTSSSAVADTSVRLLAGFYLARTGTSATEIRFGEITQDIGKSDALKSTGAEYFFSGTLSLYMPAGTVVRVRYWAAAGGGASGSQTVTLIGDYASNASYLTVVEHPEY